MFCGCENEVNVVEASTGRLLRTLEGDTEPVMSLVISWDDEVRPRVSIPTAGQAKSCHPNVGCSSTYVCL